MNVCEARGGYEKRRGGAVRFRPDTKSWGGRGGGGRQLVPEGGISYKWGGGGGGGRPPPPSPEPMLDPGLSVTAWESLTGHSHYRS